MITYNSIIAIKNVRKPRHSKFVEKKLFTFSERNTVHLKVYVFFISIL